METGRNAHFRETMAGTWKPLDPAGNPAGDSAGDPGGAIRFEIAVDTKNGVDPFGTVIADVAGTLSARGLAESAPVVGTIEISPIKTRRLRYRLEFSGDDGNDYRFDGWKSIKWTRALSTWTTLPGSIYDGEGETIGTAVLRFSLRDLPSMLKSMKLKPKKDVDRLEAGERDDVDGDDLDRRVYDGRPGRMEVWYETFNDTKTGTGFWIHHEIVAPTRGGEPYAHGWAAVFPAAGRDAAIWGRFGPVPLEAGRWFSAGDVVAEPGRRAGSATTEGGSKIRWELTYEATSEPLFTFPRRLWENEILPSAQIVPAPTAVFNGTVSVGDEVFDLDSARGGTARIYGRGNAERWAWLHADLGGKDVLEVVVAASRHGFVKHLHLRPLAFVQLRLAGEDWPGNSVVSAPKFKAHLGTRRRTQFGPLEFSVTGRVGKRRLSVSASLPEDKTVTVDYVDPDGATATCLNSEVADAHVVVTERVDGIWRIEKEWRLFSGAHAEIGFRS
jgi:hypothetical protein